MTTFEKILITERGRKIIDTYLAEGFFSASEVIGNALSTFDIVQRDSELRTAVLKAELQKGLDSGPGKAYTKETVHELFDDIEKRGRESLNHAQEEWLERIKAELEQ